MTTANRMTEHERESGVNDIHRVATVLTLETICLSDSYFQKGG